MSLWLQTAIEALTDGAYERFRQNLLPTSPIPLPDCMMRELEFAERRCRNIKKDRLFPIRFLWLLEANEQRLWGLPPLGRSLYHPEKLLELWDRVSTDPGYRQELEAEGFRFDLKEKAFELTPGWVYIGNRFVADLLEIESAIGVELMFPGSSTEELRPAFQESRRHCPCEGKLT